MGLVRGEQGRDPWILAICSWQSKPCPATIRSDLRNTVARNCKHCGHDGLAPKNYFHGWRLLPVSGIAASHAAEILASPSGSSVLWLAGDAFSDRHRRRVAEDSAAGTRK